MFMSDAFPDRVDLYLQAIPIAQYFLSLDFPHRREAEAELRSSSPAMYVCVVELLTLMRSRCQPNNPTEDRPVSVPCIVPSCTSRINESMARPFCHGCDPTQKLRRFGNVPGAKLEDVLEIWLRQGVDTLAAPLTTAVRRYLDELRFDRDRTAGYCPLGVGYKVTVVAGLITAIESGNHTRVLKITTGADGGSSYTGSVESIRYENIGDIYYEIATLHSPEGRTVEGRRATATQASRQIVFPCAVLGCAEPRMTDTRHPDRVVCQAHYLRHTYPPVNHLIYREGELRLIMAAIRREEATTNNESDLTELSSRLDDELSFVIAVRMEAVESTVSAVRTPADRVATNQSVLFIDPATEASERALYERLKAKFEAPTSPPDKTDQTMDRALDLDD